MHSLKRIPAHPALVIAAIIVLLAAHGAILYLFRQHLALSMTLVSGIVVLIVIKHLGLVAPLSAYLRRRFRR